MPKNANPQINNPLTGYLRANKAVDIKWNNSVIPVLVYQKEVTTLKIRH